MLSRLIFLVNMDNTFLVDYENFLYLSRRTASPQIILSWLIFLVNKEIAVPVNYETFRYLSQRNASQQIM